MGTGISYQDRVAGALYGVFIADALAMPVHWYYDTNALRRDYGLVQDYQAPKNPHPDSILWRSSYHLSGTKGDILHNQVTYWGQKGIHYHQFLRAGENTLNGQLAAELLAFLAHRDSYETGAWLDHFITFLTTPGHHRDTYVEEYLRHFFTNFSRGVEPEQCGRKDEHHIGGLTLMLPLTIFFSNSPDYASKVSQEHLALTHGGPLMSKAAALVCQLLIALLHGTPMIEALRENLPPGRNERAGISLFELLDYPDHVVIGRHFSSACYLDQALPATLYLAAKYHDRPAEALIANTMCGGDNCGRGAVLGALLGAACGIEAWPKRWRTGLYKAPVMPT